MDFLSSEILLSLVTLTFLEIILGIDNLIFISIAVTKLSRSQQRNARIFGLSLALIIRIIMLLTLSWVMSMTKPLFYLGESAFSVKNFLLIFGGLFLIIKSGYEIFSDIFPSPINNKSEKQSNIKKNMLAVIAQICIIDFVFSFDSVITAIGMTNNIPVIIIAITISMIVMIFASGKISDFLQTYPSLKIVAIAFILVVGIILLADGLNIYIDKGYLYFSLFFTITVECLNIMARKKNG